MNLPKTRDFELGACWPICAAGNGWDWPDRIFLEFNGKPIKSVKTGFARAVSLAQLNGGGSMVVPHTLRHTAATWLMQRGVPAWEAAGYLGMSA